MLQVLDASAVRRWCEDGHAALSGARAEIDGLNVFPVPDGDTGTNLLLTVESVVEAVRAAGDDLPSVAAALTRGALTGARGNSGVILSQLLRGLAEVLADGPADGAGLARGLARGADLAYDGVAAPVEGTLLTVAREAARGAAGVSQLGDAVTGAVAAAAAALALTQQQLPVLRDAGVVDAGSRGWLVLLEALAAVVQEEPAPAATARPAPPAAAPAVPSAPAYEVQYLLACTDEQALATLRHTLAGLGDSLAVAGADGLYAVHVHVDDVGAAVEAGVDAGRPSRIRVSRFADRGDGCAGSAARAVVVAGADVAGLSALLVEAGALVVPAGAELAAALLSAAEVVLLPAPDLLDGDLAGLLDAARAAGSRIEVVRTRSVVQVLAALAVRQPSRELADEVVEMRAAVQATRTGEVRRAVAEATTSAGICLPGDALGVVDGRVEVVGADVGWVALRLLERLAPGAELVTVVLGAGAPDGLADRLRAAATGVELVVLEGGQADPPVLVGTER